MDYGSSVLAGILPNNKTAFYDAVEAGISKEHFSSAYHRLIWEFIAVAFDRYADLPGTDAFQDYATRIYAKKKEDKSAVLVMEWVKLVEHPVPLADFRYALAQIIDLRTQRLTGEALAKTYEILEEGLFIDGERLEGQESARKYLVNELSKIDSSIVVENAPEGDLKDETEKILKDYEKRRDNPTLYGGINFGIAQLDANLDGLMPGDLAIIAAFTGHGKSHMITQLAWHAAVKQKKNFYLSTSETVRDQFLGRLIARHSREPQFGKPDGINARKILHATMNDLEFKIFQDVLGDIHDNPDYGSFYVAQIPSGASLTYIESRVRAYVRNNPLDLLMVDSLNLLSPLSKRGNEREEYNDTLKRAKAFATELAIPIVSPWQMTRSAFQAAVSSNTYQLASLSDTSEAEKSASHIITLLRPDAEDNSVVAQVLKSRTGEAMKPETIYIDYRNSYFGESPKHSAAAPSAGVFSNFR